jgi:predicted site-specific integrase-resolvase
MYYTREEALSALEITAPTLYVFVKDGLLVKYRIAKGRVFFLKEQVDKLAKERREIKAAE